MKSIIVFPILAGCFITQGVLAKNNWENQDIQQIKAQIEEDKLQVKHYSEKLKQNQDLLKREHSKVNQKPKWWWKKSETAQFQMNETLQDLLKKEREEHSQQIQTLQSQIHQLQEKMMQKEIQDKKPKRVAKKKVKNTITARQKFS